jgi:outer membrane lipoprotein carrier protein
VLLSVSAIHAADLDSVLRGIEARYNSARTLSVQFEQKYRVPGQMQRVETGALTLRKPGRMRWEYSSPAGKLLVSDGKRVWFYTPESRRAEWSKVKESEDLRTPLAFLLGKLDFKREFGDFEMNEAGGAVVVKATPKTDRMPYARVEFTVTGDGVIRRLLIAGVDRSVNEFAFAGEKLNPVLPESQFQFKAPQGVEVVEVRSFGDQEQE